MLASGGVLTLAVLVFLKALKGLKNGQDRNLQSFSWITALLGLTSVLALIWVVWNANLTPKETAHDSVMAVMFIYILIHSALATTLSALQALRVRLGYVSAIYPNEPFVLRLFWMFTLGIFWASFAAFVLLPMGWGLS